MLGVVSLVWFRWQFLNLRLNFLNSIKGIQSLKVLRRLDCRWNPRLNVAKTLKKLSKASTTVLDEVNLAPSEAIAAKPSYKHNVLKALLPVHRHLRLLEGVLISPSQRIKVWRSKLGLSKHVRVVVVVFAVVVVHGCGAVWKHCCDVLMISLVQEASEYRFHLALLLSVVPVKDRSYHPEDVVPGLQYQPEDVKCFLWLQVRIHSIQANMCPSQVAVCVPLDRNVCRGQNLGRSSLPSLEAYCNIEDLNLANNRLTTVFGWGIESLSKLRRLDLHGNRIADDVQVCHVVRWQHQCCMQCTLVNVACDVFDSCRCSQSAACSMAFRRWR